MDIGSRVMGTCGTWSGSAITEIDVLGTVRRLLLFETYVVVSTRLQEFPHLIRYFGLGGTLELLQSGMIEIRCECLQLAQTGQSDAIGDLILPPYFLRFNWIDAHNKKQYISNCLAPLHELPNFKHSDVLKLKRAIVDAIRPLPQGIRSRLFPAFIAELNDPVLLRGSINMVILQELKAHAVPYTLAIHQESADVFRVVSDLASVAKISDEKAHRIIERGVMAVAGLSQAIMEMDAYSAISGFTYSELPLFRNRLRDLYDRVASERDETTFDRVIEISDLADYDPSSQRVNVEMLQKARASSELKEFRAWLPNMARASDAEIKDAVGSIRARLGLKVGGPVGKITRALITSGVLVKSLLGSIVLNLCDAFIVEKLLPRTGIAAFVNETYPSLFQDRGTVQQDQEILRIEEQNS